MIVDERMVTYIRSLERPENPVIEAIEQEALDSFVPIIRKETQSFLKVMMLMNRPARVLEVGTAVGFSAILMSEYLPEGSHITTIENYEKRIPIARNNFKRAGKEEQITLIEGDALEVMETLDQKVRAHYALSGSEEAENELPDAEKKTGASSDLKLTPASKVADEAEKKE